MPKTLIKLKTEKCKGCSLCVNACPKSVLSINKHKDSLNKAGHYVVCVGNAEECVGCLSCALICPDGVISIYEE